MMNVTYMRMGLFGSYSSRVIGGHNNVARSMALEQQLRALIQIHKKEGGGSAMGVAGSF